MSSRVHWSDLRIGLIAVAAIAVFVFSILVFARVGALHGETRKIYVTAPDASGVLDGTDVSLAGKKMGRVTAVRYRPINTDIDQRVVIETDILVEAMPLIRGDSWADIRPGGNLIGSPVVYIRPGSLKAPELKEGDTVASRNSGRIQAFGEQIDSLAEKLNALAATSGALVDKMSDPSNSVGAFRSRGIERFRSLGAVVSTYTERSIRGGGSIGLAYRGAVGARISRVMAAKDSITFLLSSGNGNIGRFRRDSTLSGEVASVRAGFDSLRALTSASGTATRLRSDTTLGSEIARARAELDSLMRQIKKHPTRYISR